MTKAKTARYELREDGSQNPSESEELDATRPSRLKDLDGIARQLELPGLKTRSSRNQESATNKPKPVSEKVSQRKNLLKQPEQSEDEDQISSLKQELKRKTGLLIRCQRHLKVLLNQVASLKKGVEDAKKHILNMTYGTAFAKNKRFIKLFTKMMEKMVSRKVAQQALEGSVNDNMNSAGTSTPDFISAGTEKGGNSFEALIAYVEKKESEDRQGLSNDLVFHNINCTWNKPCALKITEEGEPIAVTGTDEKLPPGPELHSARKLKGPEVPLRKKVKKTTASRKVPSRVRTSSNSQGKARLGSQDQDARLGKRVVGRSNFRKLQEEIQESIKTQKGKKLKMATLSEEAPGDRFLTNLTADTPADLVFQKSDKKSTNKKKAPIGRFTKGSSPENPESRHKRENTPDPKSSK